MVLPKLSPVAETEFLFWLHWSLAADQSGEAATPSLPEPNLNHSCGDFSNFLFCFLPLMSFHVITTYYVSYSFFIHEH